MALSRDGWREDRDRRGRVVLLELAKLRSDLVELAVLGVLK